MPFPAILAALGRGAAVAARAAVQAAVSAGRAGLQVAATGARSLGQGAASIAKGAVNAARGGASSAVGAVKSAATTTATRIASVANPASLQAAAKSAIQAASSTASAAGQSANSAAGSVGRAGQQASQQLGQFARNAMQNMQQTAQAAISRAGGAQIGGPGPQQAAPSTQSVVRESSVEKIQNTSNLLNPGKQMDEAIRKFAELPKKLKDFGESLVEGRRALLDYNGSIAESVHRLDSERIQRNIQFANATQGTSKYQTEAHSRLEKALQPGFIAMTNVMNKVVGVLENGLASVITGMTDITQKILDAMPGKIGERFKKIMEDIKSAPADMPLNTFLNQMQNGQVFKRNMPPIHKRPGVGDTGPKT